MSASQNTGAPSGVPTVDDAIMSLLTDAGAHRARAFLESLQAMAAPCEPMSETEGFALDAAGQHGFEHINDDATLYAVSERDLAAFVLNVRSCAVSRAEKLARELPVQVLNLSDGFRLNFRAPDGRRATLFLDVLLANYEIGDSDLVKQTMRAAIAAYPVAGDPLPAACTDQACRPCMTGDGPCSSGVTVTEIDGAISDMTDEQRARAVTVYDHFDVPHDSHPDDAAAVHTAMRRYVQTGELPK